MQDTDYIVTVTIRQPRLHPDNPFPHAIVGHKPDGWEFNKGTCSACAWLQGLYYHTKGEAHDDTVSR